MTFVNDTFSFVNRTSTIANELVENQKSNSGNFAYFFEQDYNFILVKTSRIIKIISKKYEEAVAKLYRKKIQFSSHKKIFIHEDWVTYE
jgi:thiaminase